ncbi:MAG: metal-dependent transcriptional regulator [bacterium]
MKIQKSAEDYLESILMIRERQGYVRSIDVATELGVTKPSVSYATKRLRENGFITVDDNGHLGLTDAGYEIAARIYERHKVLTAVLVSLGVESALAAEDACKLEHDLSPDSFAAIKNAAAERGLL